MTARRRAPRRVLVAAAVTIAVLGTGLAAGLAAHGGQGSGAAAPGRWSASSVHASYAGISQLPLVRLAGLRWSDFYGVQLPSSAVAGPRHIDGGLASGFSDAPLGALLAAMNIAVRANAQWGPAIFVPTIRDQVTGPDATALLASCQAGYEQASQAAHLTGGQPLGAVNVVEEAFRWVAYTPADATVDLVSAGPDSQGGTVRATTQVEVVWSGGDWRVVAPPGGDWGHVAARLSSLAGYTVFPGQG